MTRPLLEQAAASVGYVAEADDTDADLALVILIRGKEAPA
jgi:hypothetical protein